MLASYSPISNWDLVLQDNEDSKKPKRKKTKTKRNTLAIEGNKDENAKENEVGSKEKTQDESKEVLSDIFENNDTNNKETTNGKVDENTSEDSKSEGIVEKKSEEDKMQVSLELEDGECSGSSDDNDSSSNASTATVDDEGKSNDQKKPW